MRVAVRAVAAGIFAVVAVVLMMLSSTMASIFSVTALAATTALIMGGTGDPLSTPKDTLAFIQQYMGMAVNNYIAPSSTTTPTTGIPTGPYNAVAVITPEEWAPQHGTLTLDESIALGTANLHNCITASGCVYNTEVGSTAPAASDKFVVFGYSQSATIGTFEKRRLAAEYPNGGGPDVSFEFIGNGNRPNGGFLARGPEGFTIPPGVLFGGATFSGPTPTNTQYETVDIAGQYDVWADVPLNPLNALAIANWYSSYVHYNYKNVSLNDPGIINQGQYGDTSYYMIPTKILPLLAPVTQVPVFGYALADAMDAPFRVLVEAAYDRTLSPGQHAPWNPLYMPNPVELAANFAVALPTGLDNAFEDMIGVRPFGTVRPGPYGVGGPDVTYVNPPTTTATTATNATTETDTATNDHDPSAGTEPTAVATDSKTVTKTDQESDSSLSDAVSLRGSTTEESTKESSKESATVAETPKSSSDSKLEDETEAEAVKNEEPRPEAATDDAAASDAATTQSSSAPKPSQDATSPAGTGRHAFSAKRPNSWKPVAKESATESTSEQSEPKHAK